MLQVSTSPAPPKWGNLSAQRGNLTDLEIQCLVCGRYHLTQDHWKYQADMPQEPAALIDDLIKMRYYKPEVIAVANAISQAELRTALFIKMAGQNNPKREGLVKDLIRLAGGLDAAFSAAFGPQVGRFFNDAQDTLGSFTRRRFLQNVVIGAALVTLANCTQPPEKKQPAQKKKDEPPQELGRLEKKNLKIAFLPITCASPIIMSKPLGFYEKYGLNVELKKYTGWSVVRDAVIAGELDASHMLAPMPIAMSLGLGSAAFPVKLASIENNNGQGIAVAKKYLGKIKGPANFKGMTIGIPYDYSNHNLLLRYYLATGGVDPDKDVKLVVLPLLDAISKMKSEQIDAFILPDNFTQRVVWEGIGFIHLLTKELWPGHPCCAFTASQAWIDEHPNTFRALNKAIIDGTTYANQPENRQQIAEAIAPREYLNQPLEVLEAVMTGQFEDGQGNTRNEPDRIYFDPYPWKSFATWISTQLMRWKYMTLEQLDKNDEGQEIFLTDLARELAIELGEDAPIEVSRVEKLKFDTLNPNSPVVYVGQQRETYGM
ncbi:MAG: ABC transporter substrate-binding protein [Symploca sp. SIO2E6]|nr:ABC transporter substrate-binding protein [Symploca sp. SIO2E6]